MNIDELAKAHQYDYAGYLLTDWYEAAFPTYNIFVQVQFVDRQELPYVEQFVLRILDVGLQTTDDIGHALGLDEIIVYETINRLSNLGSLVIMPGKKDIADTITLSKKGRKLLQEMTIQQPIRETTDFCIDALTGEYFVYRRLLTPKQLRMSELHQVPTYLSRPTLENLDLIAIRRLWNSTQRLLPKNTRSREIFLTFRECSGQFCIFPERTYLITSGLPTVCPISAQGQSIRYQVNHPGSQSDIR